MGMLKTHHMEQMIFPTAEADGEKVRGRHKQLWRCFYRLACFFSCRKQASNRVGSGWTCLLCSWPSFPRCCQWDLLPQPPHHRSCSVLKSLWTCIWSPECKCRRCSSIRAGVSHFSGSQCPGYKLGVKVSPRLPSAGSCGNWNEAAFMHLILLAFTSNYPTAREKDLHWRLSLFTCKQTGLT